MMQAPFYVSGLLQGMRSMLIICCEVFVFLDSILQNIIMGLKKNTVTFKNLCTCVFMCQRLLIIESNHITQMFMCWLCSPSFKEILSRDEYFFWWSWKSYQFFFVSVPMGFTIFGCLSLEKIKNKVSACFSEITH